MMTMAAVREGKASINGQIRIVVSSNLGSNKNYASTSKVVTQERKS
jgi:hypothetical protein